ncbi:RDD family protein [Luteimonas aquatica]|uniref:RDD family protein n=1 Tax=Luteimonas aquatica TaxID=450364 RepID=UPI001F596B88|nr:RDD family protein [Luteimonas aquatica]
MSTWYYADAGHQRRGPIEAEELARLRRDGQLQWDTLVWRDGMAQWQPLSSVAGELPLQQETAPAPAPEAGGQHVTDSPYAPPAAPLLRQGAVHTGGEVVYAGFWKRVAAYMIDGFIVGVASNVVQVPLLLSIGMLGAGFDEPTPALTGGFVIVMIAAYVLPLLIQMAYFAWFHASGKQATLGKMAVGIKVVDEAGGRISFLRGVGRYFATILSSLLLCIGFLMAAFTDRKRALHDYMAGTLVVDQWAYTDRPDLQRPELGTVALVILILFGVLLLVGIGFFVMLVGVLAASGAGH